MLSEGKYFNRNNPFYRVPSIKITLGAELQYQA